MPIKVEAYRCQYCGDLNGVVRRPYNTLRGCKQHERWCYDNPDRVKCPNDPADNIPEFHMGGAY